MSGYVAIEGNYGNQGNWDTMAQHFGLWTFGMKDRESLGRLLK